MTLVDADTGEVVHLDPSAAEVRADRIRSRLDAIADNYSAVLPMIREAIEQRDDLALGYRSPGDYVSDRFGDALANLGIEVRRAVVHELTEAGLSTRAIAPIVGVNNATVQRDRAAAGVAPATPDDDLPPVTGRDGKQYPARQPTPKQHHDEHQATSDTTWADVVTAYPHAADASPSHREGLRRGFAQLQTLSGPEKVRREEAFLASIDAALLTPEQRQERRENPTEHRSLTCKTCGRPF